MRGPDPLRSVWGVAGKQVYEMELDGRVHRVETSVGDGWKNSATWWVDGEEVATRTSASEDNLYLVAAKDHELADSLGAVRARFTSMSKPVRATWFEGSRSAAEVAARVGTGGIDLVPEPGSPAALREERARANPHLYAARHVAGGMAKVVVPILVTALMIWLAGRIPWPDWDLPSIDLPSFPWPSIDLPSIPRLDWEAPGWVRWVADKAKYVVPILIGLALARSEVRRRRQQDELRERRAAGGPSAPSAPSGEPGQERESGEGVEPGEARSARAQRGEMGIGDDDGWT